MDTTDPREPEALPRREPPNAQEARSAPPPLERAHWETTIAQVRRMAERETHPSWIHAAYADLARRLTRVEERLDEITDGLRMIIGQLAALERQDPEPPQRAHEGDLP